MNRPRTHFASPVARPRVAPDAPPRAAACASPGAACASPAAQAPGAAQAPRALPSRLAVLSLVAGSVALAACGAMKSSGEAARASAPARALQPAYAPPASPAREAKQAAPAAPASDHAQPTASTSNLAIAQAPPEPPGTEHYQDYGVNPVVDPAKDRFSTFAIDVDTASYAIARRKIEEGSLPPFAAVRTEEFVNSFAYGYAAPARGAFAVHLAAAPSPYAAGHHLVRVALQGRRVSHEERAPVHLVYLVDVSGSMMSADKIDLAKKGLRMLTGTLKAGDTVALCTYAGHVREVLPPTGVDRKGRILAAIDELTAGGSTAMASGLQLAYDLASRTRVRGHVNRVVVLSDGDANVGPTSHAEILRSIEKHRAEGITLSTVGFGDGNYKDTTMEQLADHGDGNYTYVDGERQARKVFVDDVDGMLEVIARDVKVQVEFDPRAVRSYRLVGYENRDVADKDFRDDKVDGGEIGAGHSVTALYDVVLADSDRSPLVVRVRHKPALEGEQASEEAHSMPAASIAPSFAAAPSDLRFAAAVAGFAEVLRKSPHARDVRLEAVEEIARSASEGRAERRELADLVHRARQLTR